LFQHTDNTFPLTFGNASLCLKPPPTALFAMEITNLTHPSSHAMANRCGCPGFTASIGSLAQSQIDPPCDSHVECGFNWFKSHSVTVPSNATETKRAF
jgi:hypothetical protein